MLFKNYGGVHPPLPAWAYTEAMAGIIKLLRVMKITAILLTICGLQVSAHSSGQITYSANNVSLDVVFKEVGKQSGYSFFYRPQDLSGTKKISIHVSDVSVDEFMKKCLEGQPLEYTNERKSIFVSRKKNKTIDVIQPPLIQNTSPIDVRGRVINEDGHPVAGVTVMIKGTKVGTSTNAEGEFELSKVDPNATLLLTAVNIQSVEANINGRKEISVQVKGRTGKLDEVQVIAYGKTSQRWTVGNITSVKGSEFENQPINNPLLALQGRVPGLLIEQSNGLPGTGVSVRVQGQNSIRSGNDPLYVIDGVPYISLLPPNIGGILGRSGAPGANQNLQTGSGNPLSYINPSDIESIEILKDADATAIFGSRAANGAILITTKGGKIGKTKLSLNIQQGVGRVAKKLNLMNTSQYLEMRREAKFNDNAPIYPTDYDINGFWDTTASRDWQDILLGKNANYTDIRGSISGGVKNTNFLLSLGTHRETTVFPGDLSDNKFSIHFNVSHASENQRFKIELTTSYLKDRNKLIGQDLTFFATSLPPTAPKLFNSDGSLNWEPNVAGTSTWTNPLSYIYNRYTNQTDNLISNATASLSIIEGLDLVSNFGYTSLNMDEVNINPSIGRRPEERPTYQRVSSFSKGKITSWIIEPQLKFNRNFDIGKVDVLLGTTFQKRESSQYTIHAIGFNNDVVMEDLRSAPNLISDASFISDYNYNALYARVDFNSFQKYLLSVNVRKDGSSRFGNGINTETFYSIGLGWIFSKEKVLSSLKWLSFGKLKGSYGTTGNDQIGDYTYLNLYTSSAYGVGYQNVPGLNVDRLPNPHLEWEKTQKLNIGLDFGFFRDKLILNANYYRNSSSNQLLTYGLPIMTGFNSILSNFPATVRNYGLELSLNSTIIQTKEFSWTSNANLTFPRNKLVSFKDIESSTFASVLVIGEPITITKVFKYSGVNKQSGIYEFIDKNGNITSNPTFGIDDHVVVNTLPKFYGGFQNTFQYRNFEASFLIQFVKQLGLDYLFGSFYNAAPNSNQPAYLLSRWRKPGDNSNIQKFNSDYSLFLQNYMAANSDAAYVDASYLRLKNISISYHIPNRVTKSLHLENARFYFQGQNLFTITNYKGLDPETRNVSSLPPLQILTLGIQLTF